MSTKQKILNLLFAHQKTWVSGDELANRFKISRTMIWKHIKALQDEGFEIVSKKSAGYRLLPGYALNAILIESKLKVKAHVQTFKTINSTNTYLKEYMTTHQLTAPLAVIAEEQSAGYGRFKREFYSPANGGLYLSLGLPLKEQLNPSLLTTSIAVGVVQTLKLYFPEQSFSVKWVNDVFLNNKKVAGILTEATADLESLAPNEVVIGTGINLTTTKFPSKLKKVAQAAGKDLPADINEIAASLIDHLIKIFDNYADGRYMKEYKRLLNLLQKEVVLQVGGKEIKGLVTDLSADGGLTIQTANGKAQTYYSGEVQKIYY